MMTIPQSSLALLLVVAAASNGFSKAANLRQRNLGGTTITTNVETYTAYEDYAAVVLAAENKQRTTKSLSPIRSATEGPGITDDFDSVTPLSTTSTPATDSRKGKDCESSFECTSTFSC
ncbi:unnamed protein product [Peronospora destructor]|uniref:Secreted protein n=1 Tax=Peronospora destructor TaxID=86335 RepID=A0AAV0V5U4_9STRA|nr:unnamed protein product [Peronospora destructor]